MSRDDNQIQNNIKLDTEMTEFKIDELDCKGIKTAFTALKRKRDDKTRKCFVDLEDLTGVTIFRWNQILRQELARSDKKANKNLDLSNADLEELAEIAQNK